MGIGFFVGSLSTLRPLFSRRWDGPGPRKPEDDHELNDKARPGFPRRTTATEMKRLSPAFRDSEEQAIRDMIVTSKDMFTSKDVYHAQ